jgi:beta-lactamase regulating signal transducer with metallopeptidase domain
MNELSPQTLHAIGWTLLHFIWQGTALAALFAAVLVMSRNANVRYVLGVATLILMMAAPVVTFVSLNRAPIPAATIDATQAAGNSGIAGVVSSDQAIKSERLAQVLAPGANREQTMLWLVQAWLIGVMLFSMRTAGGLLWLGRARRGQIEPLPDEVYRQCLVLQRRMGLHWHIRFGQCDWLDAPAVLGWFRPIVLVTTQALTGLNRQQLQAIIVHELAHIRRHDAFVNLFQIVAEMLLFYHPAVWWVSRRIRIEREVCCDNQALAACAEPVNYARALTLMEEWRAAPSMMMAANRGPLTERVLRVLDAQGTSARSRVVGAGISMTCVAAALFAGNVLVAAAQPVAGIEAPAPVVAPAREAPPVLSPAPPPKEPPKEQQVPRGIPRPPSPPEPAATPAEPAATPAEPASKQSSYMDRLAAVGLKDLDIEELIAMKVQGITPDYIVETRRLVADPSIDDVIAMKVHGITPGFISGLQKAGLDIRTADDFVAARVHGITPEFVTTALNHGFRDLTVEKLIMLRNIDVL